jgi:hypothetical protein
MVPDLSLRRDLVRELADQRVGHGQDDDVGPVDGAVGVHAGNAQLVLQALAAGGAGFHMAHAVGRALQVLRQANTHLAAGTEQRNRRHQHLRVVADVDGMTT